MIYSLRGKLIHVTDNAAVVECGGVGYLCSTTRTTLNALPPVGEETMLYTYLNVREGAIDLFGFASIAEVNCFKQLTSVSGVGPKVALAILSELKPDQLMTAFSMACKGIGATFVTDTLLHGNTYGVPLCFYKMEDELSIRNVYLYRKRNKYLTKAMEEFAAELGVRPEEILYVGDNSTDWMSAHGAGASFVGVRTGSGSDEMWASVDPDIPVIDYAGDVVTLL